MIRLMPWFVAFAFLGCDDNKQPSYVSGTYELFFDVDVNDRMCDDNLFTAKLELGSSEFAESEPSKIQVLHWHFIDEVWTEIGTLPAAVDIPQDYELDLSDLGGCDTQGLSIVFVPQSDRSYGHPKFVTLESGASGGGGSRYSFETDINTVEFRCPAELIDRAEASVYNYRKRTIGTAVQLSLLETNDVDNRTNNVWSGQTPSLRPSEDVLIFLGLKDDEIVCSLLL